MPYHHITFEERVKIEAWIKANHTNSEIARFLGRSRSAIGDEIARGGGRDSYSAKRSEARRKDVRKAANTTLKKIVPDSVLAREIEAKVKLYWSPEQISGRLRKGLKGKAKRAIPCHETIYSYIYEKRSELKKYLRCRKGRYRRRYGTKLREKKREELKKRRIDTRPKIIEKRTRIGDWEGDTIVGGEKTQHVLTHVDRTSGYLLMDKLEHATAEETRKKTCARFSKLPKKKCRTSTYDNGVTFSEHELTARETSMDIYFAYPYHSWERGTNENANGLVRQFLPKGSPFKNITQQKLDRIAKLINNRPRKRHGYFTPQEVFNR